MYQTSSRWSSFAVNNWITAQGCCQFCGTECCIGTRGFDRNLCSMNSSYLHLFIGFDSSCSSPNHFSFCCWKMVFLGSTSHCPGASPGDMVAWEVAVGQGPPEHSCCPMLGPGPTSSLVSLPLGFVTASWGCVGLNVTLWHASRRQQDDTLMLLLSACQAVPTHSVWWQLGRKRQRKAGMKYCMALSVTAEKQGLRPCQGQAEGTALWGAWGTWVTY